MVQATRCAQKPLNKGRRANTTWSESRDKTMLWRSQRCRMLALDPFSWRAKEKVDSNASDADLCVLSDHRQNGKRRRHWPAAVNANTQLPGWVAAVYARTQFHATGMPTCLMLITVLSQNMCSTCFVLCGVFSTKSTRRHIDVGSKIKTSIVPDVSCVRLVGFTNINMSRASPSSLLQHTLGEVIRARFFGRGRRGRQIFFTLSFMSFEK